MFPDTTQHPQDLVNAEFTPNWVNVWDLQNHMRRFLVGIDSRRIVKMQILKYTPERQQYRVRFYDANSQEEDCWVEVNAFTHMLYDHLHANAEEPAAQLFERRTMVEPTSKFEIAESLAIICVLLVFVLMYLLRR